MLNEQASAMDRINDPERIRQSRVRSLLTSGMSREFCVDTLYNILREDYDITGDPKIIKEALDLGTHGLFNPDANEGLNSEELEHLTNHAMSVLEKIAREAKAEAANNNPAASQEELAA